MENGKAQAANFPFCTIEPNVGIVAVPDPRLHVLSGLSKSQKAVPASVEFVDIAGLVKGASQGEVRWHSVRSFMNSFSLPFWCKWFFSYSWRLGLYVLTQFPFATLLVQGLGNKFLSHIREVDSILQVCLSSFIFMSLYGCFRLCIPKQL